MSASKALNRCLVPNSKFVASLLSARSYTTVAVRRNNALSFPLLHHLTRLPTAQQTFLQSSKDLGVAHAPKARYASSSSPEMLRQTPLHELHVRHGAKMVPFGGYSMPVQYEDQGISQSHMFTREKASLFDVSHMVQHYLSGPGAQGLLEQLTPTALAEISNHQSSLSCFLHPGTGGIVDDSVITRLGPEAFYFVTNAACREKDAAYIGQAISDWRNAGNQHVEWKVLEGQGLIALQGPLASALLKPLILGINPAELDELYFGQSRYIQFQSRSGQQTSPCLVSRGGYTGEDGFEISVPPEDVEAFSEHLLSTAGPEQLRLAGLGARDSLRLEAGMCLYGHDLDDTTTPIEGGLSWVVGKGRRSGGGFNGDEVILRQLRPKKEGGGVERRRVGFVVEGAPAREGAEVIDADGNKIGHITSGCPSPALKKNIAMGYVQTGFNKAGTELQVLVRGKKRQATVTKMPFVPSKYWKGGQSPG